MTDPNVEDDEDIGLPTVAEVRRMYKRCVKDMMTGDPARMASLIMQVQRCRLVLRFLDELESGKAADDTYKEMVLTLRTLRVDMAGPQDIQEEETAQELLDRTIQPMGLGPRQAADLLKVFERVRGDDGSTIPESYEPPE